jgi:hypothetical protein
MVKLGDPSPWKKPLSRGQLVGRDNGFISENQNISDFSLRK